MISNGDKRVAKSMDKGIAKSKGQQKWHYLAIKKLSALLRRITSKRHGDFYCLNCFHSFITKTKFKLHKKVCENKFFCNITSSKGTKILKLNQYRKSDKVPFINYADLECIMED